MQYLVCCKLLKLSFFSSFFFASSQSLLSHQSSIYKEDNHIYMLMRWRHIVVFTLDYNKFSHLPFRFPQATYILTFIKTLKFKHNTCDFKFKWFVSLVPKGVFFYFNQTFSSSPKIDIIILTNPWIEIFFTEWFFVVKDSSPVNLERIYTMYCGHITKITLQLILMQNLRISLKCNTCQKKIFIFLQMGQKRL